jgi:hypothetical protein
MDSKQKFTLAAGMGVMALAVGLLAGPQLVMGIRAMASGRQGCIALADWVNQGSTVAEVGAQADLIVRVRVVKSETWELRQMLPQYAADAKTITKYVEDVMPFTYSKVHVLETYKGSTEDTITVGQTGALPGTVAADVRAFAFVGDPIYTLGSEHILFLLDATEGSVHDVGGKLYYTVNPFGRYEIEDGAFITPGDLMEGYEIIPPGLPTSLNELVEQIRQSVES